MLKNIMTDCVFSNNIDIALEKFSAKPEIDSCEAVYVSCIFLSWRDYALRIIYYFCHFVM